MGGRGRGRAERTAPTSWAIPPRAKGFLPALHYGLESIFRVLIQLARVSHVRFGNDPEGVWHLRARKLLEESGGVSHIANSRSGDFPSGRSVRTPHLCSDNLEGSLVFPGSF